MRLDYIKIEEMRLRFSRSLNLTFLVRRDFIITIKLGGESSMKGVVAALVAASLLACVGFVMANPPLPEPLQYEQFCDNQKVSGTGAIDISTSVIDKKIALEYYNVMAGDGDLELDQTHAYSQKGINEGPLFNDSHNSSLNLFEKEKLTYSAKKAPLTGGKYLNSKAFYGGIGADVQEMFSVNQMEKDQTSFFSSTANLDNGSPNTQHAMNAQLKAAGLADQAWGNDNNVSSLMTNAAWYSRSSAHDRHRYQEQLQWNMGRRRQVASDILQGYQAPRAVHRNLRSREDGQVP